MLDKVVAYRNVVFALMVREYATRFGRSFGGYVWAILEPILIIIVLAYIFHLYFGEPPLGQSFALFYCTGLVPYVVFSEIVSQSGNAVIQNKPLLNLRPVGPLETVLARFLLSTLTLTVVSTVAFCIIVVYVDEVLTIRWTPLFAGLLGAAALGLGVGTLNAFLFLLVPTWRNLWNIVHRPLFLISGVFFLYDSLFPELQRILIWNPLLHSITQTRIGFYEAYEASWWSYTYPACFALFCFILGVVGLFRWRDHALENI